jgi:hypothetical protein
MKCQPSSLVMPSLAVLAVLALAPKPAHADFFDDARKTFQTDIPHFFTQDVPHFFQDDIPCAVVGHPTSGERKSCDSKPASNKNGAASDAPDEKPKNDNSPQNGNP